MGELLFRPEVMAAQQGSRLGQAVFYQPLTVRLMVLFLLAVVVSFLLFAANAELKQTERVRGYLTSTGGEVKVYGRRMGVLTDVFVGDGDAVKAGDILAALSDPQHDQQGREQAVLALQQIDLQLQQLARRKEVVASRFDAQLAQIGQQLLSMQNVLQLLQSEQQFRHHRVELSERDLQASNKLQASNTISDREHRQAASSLYLLQQQAKAGELAIARQHQAMAEARQQLEVLSLRAQEESLALDATVSQLHTQRNDLQLQIKFTIAATRDGIVSNVVARKGDIMDTSEPLLTLLPPDNVLEAWLYLPSSALADVDIGSELMISYDAYPYQTYGSFPAQIFSVADSAMDPREFLFPVDIREPVYLVRAHIRHQGLADSDTNRFRPGMQFTADIVTGKQSVMERLMAPLSGLGRRL